MRSLVRPRTVLAETGDRAVHQPRIDLRHIRIAKPQPVHHTRPELLEQDVGLLDQRHKAVDRGRRFQVDGDGFLAPIEQHEVGTVRIRLGLVGPHLVATNGSFELDDLGPGLGQQQGTQRSGQQGAEIQHLHPSQRLRHGVPTLARSAATRARRAGA
ncbi:hypothetical protein D3C72_1739620 [compost metagenome]